MCAGVRDEIREFWLRSLFWQLDTMPSWKRQYARWRMSPSTMRLIRTLCDTDSQALYAPNLHIADYLLGKPVDLDDTAEGAVLVAS